MFCGGNNTAGAICKWRIGEIIIPICILKTILTGNCGGPPLDILRKVVTLDDFRLDASEVPTKVSRTDRFRGGWNKELEVNDERRF